MKSLSKILFVCAIAVTAVVSTLAQVKAPPIQFVERSLGNGLRVIAVKDNTSPTVSVHVLYHVGGKNDPIGRSGFAHMFEHMMFKSTKQMPNEKMDRITEDIGGWNNASTREDFTNYYEVIPSNYLEVLLWAEAERMVNLNVDEKNFSSERDVVKEEYRQSVLAQPYGRLFYTLLNERNYLVHPYRRGVIGNLDELSSATPADAKAFYEKYYRPDNATLIVVGDFDQKQLDTWIDRYFAGIPKTSGPIHEPMKGEAPRTAERRYVEYGSNVPFPAATISYLAPPSNSPDVAALTIAASIMSGGESSRLYESLIRNLQVAQEAAFDLDIRVDQGLMNFYAIASEGKTAEQLEKALAAEIAKIQSRPVTAMELTKAKNQVISRELRLRETNNGKAIALEQAIGYQGGAAEVNRYLTKLQSVTAADITRVMKKYFDPKGRVVIHYSQEAKKGDGK